MKTNNTNTTAPALYVGTYAKYNSGSIAGAWLQLEEYADKEEFLAACAELHKDEEDPEFMYQDFEGFPRSFYSESGVSDELFEWVAMDEDDRELLAAYQDAIGEGTIDDARDAFQGTYDSGADFAQQTAEDCGEIPKDLPAWIVIDWEASWSCNLQYDYSTSERDGRLWIFRNC